MNGLTEARENGAKHLVLVEVQDFKRLVGRQVVRIDGKSAVVGGKNGSGKSSFFEAMEWALLGRKGSKLARPIRDGANECVVGLEFTDGVTLRRAMSQGRQVLTLVRADGRKIAQPQTILQYLTGGASAFDVSEFFALNAKTRAELIRKALGVDVSDLDQEHAELYERRADINRATKEHEGQLAGYAEDPDAPTEEIDISALANQLTAAHAHNNEIERKRRAVASGQKTLAMQRTEIEEARAKLKALEQMEAEHRKILEGLIKDSNEQEPINTNGIGQSLADAQKTNNRVQTACQRKAILGRLEESRAKANDLSQRLMEINAEKEQRLAATEFPISGLAFDTGVGITFNGRPFSDLANSEQWRIAMALAAAQIPKDGARVISMKYGGALDNQNLANALEVAEEMDVQAFIETPHASNPDIEIVDGKITVLDKGEIK